MNKREATHFADYIPEFATHLGISSLNYLHVAVKQARYYGFEETAVWLEETQERLQRAVKEEWDELDCAKPI